jgi:hypothetical protein
MTPEEAFGPALSAIEKAVLDVVDSAKDIEWTSRTAILALRAGSSFRLSENEDAAMNAVGLALTSLKDKHRITRVHEGRGRDPHRYKSVLPPDAETATDVMTAATGKRED